MNTGIQDAHNLAWKLAIAIQNECDDDALSSSLLNSYANERKKIASENKTLSVSNYERVLEIPRALGLEPRALDALVFASNALPVPQALKSFAFEKILSAGRMQTVLLENDKKNPLGEYRREAVKRLCGTSGETLKLKFLNEELGFSYAKGVKATNPNVLAVETHPALCVNKRRRRRRHYLYDRFRWFKQQLRVPILCDNVVIGERSRRCSGRSSKNVT